MKLVKTMYSGLLILLFSSTISCGQNVPGKVKEAFNKKFPNAASVEWGKESDTEFEAEFTMNGKDYSANFNTDGTWMETEMEIEMEDLPDPVLASFARDYWGADIEEIASLMNSEGTFFEIAIQKNNEEEYGEENEEEEHEGYEENEEDEDHERGEEMEEDDEEHDVIDLVFTESGQLVKKSGSSEENEEEEDDD